MKRILFTALVSGIVAGVLLSVIQLWTVTPIILAAESYEVVPDVGAHAESVETWAPGNGFERNFYTGVSNVGAGIGFSLLIVIGLMFHPGRRWRHGLAWGACGVAVFYLVPTIAYPPAVPGTLQSDVLVWQMWWLATARARSSVWHW